MRKETAREVWNRCLRLVVRGHAAERMTNPLKGFGEDHRAGIHDEMDIDKVAEWAQDCNELTDGMWKGSMERSAGDILLTGLANTDIPMTGLNAIVEILAEASLNTDYKEKEKAQSYMKEALERRKGNVKNDDWLSATYTPKEIEHWLHDEGGIVGQNDAVKTASIIVFNHLNGRRSVNLFVGPTGSGKTEIWRRLQRRFGSDKIIIHDGSTLTAEGWKGSNKISTIFRSIEPKDREHVILVLDEADKLLEPQIGAGDTNYSFIVQNQLLKLFDGDTLFFGDDSGKDESFTVDTSGISIVLTGAFQTLLKMKSAKTGSIGFGGESHQNYDYSNTEITTDDLIESGMRQELCGRVNRIAALEPLDENALILIAKNELKRLEKVMQREISIDDDALAELANEAIAKGLGARWLNSQLNNALDELIYERPDAERFCLARERESASEM